MLNSYPRPWRIVRENSLFKVLDANGRIIGVFWFQPSYVGVQDQYPSEEEAREAATCFARLSKQPYQ